LDGALPLGARFQVPTPWLLAELGLRVNPTEPSKFYNSEGKLLLQNVFRKDSVSAVLVSREALLKVPRKNELDCVWVVAGEKTLGCAARIVSGPPATIARPTG